jgi:hypothetical protein
VTENVAYDVTGYCYYLEDGVEENNTLSFNLAAHIHAIGPKPPNGMGSQEIDPIAQNLRLTLPADVTASGFYVTNVRNNIIGNAASGVSATVCIEARCAECRFLGDDLPTHYPFCDEGMGWFCISTSQNAFEYIILRDGGGDMGLDSTLVVTCTTMTRMFWSTIPVEAEIAPLAE